MINKLHIKLLFLCIVASITMAYSQDGGMQFKTKTPNEVVVGQRFQISFELNRSGGKNFKGPDFKNFQILFGPGFSSQMQTSAGTGGNRSIYLESYTYSLKAKKAGTFKIGSAYITLKGKTYKTEPVIIQVKKSQNTSTSTQSNTNKKGDIFIRNSISKTKAYKGEVIIFAQKLYTRLTIAGINFPESEFPSFPGFWTEDLDIGELKANYETVNGKEYAVVLIKKTILIPQKTGKLKIEPTKLNLTIRSVQNVSSGWPGMNFQTYDDKAYTIRSNSATVTIKPLPKAIEPQGYEGAVGNFKIYTSLEPSTVRAGEATTFSLKISGSGNIELIGKPDIEFPDGLEIFDPETKSSITPSSSGVSGSKTYEFLIIPRIKGDYIIPSFTFSYFNPISGTYKTFETGDLNLSVSESDGTTGLSTPNMNKEEVQYFGKDIRYLYDNSSGGNLGFQIRLATPLHLILIGLGILLFVLFIIVYRKRLKITQDHEKMRHRKASGIAKKRLKRAESFMKNEDESAFFTELIQTLLGYAADKLSIQRAELTKENMKEKFIESGIKDSIVMEFIRLVEDCEYARFAPKTEDYKMEKSYTDAKSLIINMEKTSEERI